MNVKKIICVLLAFVFLAFAVVQYNDPDPWIWILGYSVPVVLFIVVPFGIPLIRTARVVFWLAMMSMVLYVPDIIDWTKDGYPSIIGSMKAETQYVELVREFLGLMIIALAMYFYPRLAK